MTTEDYEIVYTIDDYWDQPRRGVADFIRRPHHYECVFDNEKDEWSDVYFLLPLDDAAFQLHMENWKAWLRWEAAYLAGRVPLQSHPRLPEDRLRYAEIQAALEAKLKTHAAAGFTATADFKSLDMTHEAGCHGQNPDQWRVRWTVITHR
jgi:hypothetical protein